MTGARTRDFQRRGCRAFPAPDCCAQGAGPRGRRHRRRLRRRKLRPRAAQGRSAHRGDAGRGQRDLHRAAAQQRRDRRAGRICSSSNSATTRSRAPASTSRCRPRPRSIPTKRTVTLADGTTLDYERLVVSPGIEFRCRRDPGLRPTRPWHIMPPAYNDGAQVALLRRQLEAMEDGGTVVISSPVNPARCPPAPYERASLIAHYLKTKKPKSKVIVLDAKESFTMQKLFEAAWQELYPGMIEWVGLSQRRRADRGRCRDENARDRLRQIQGRRRQHHPAAEGRTRRRARRRRRPHRLVPGRSGDVRIASCSPTSTSSAMPPSPARCRRSAFGRAFAGARSAPPRSPRCSPARRRRRRR